MTMTYKEIPQLWPKKQTQFPQSQKMLKSMQKVSKNAKKCEKISKNGPVFAPINPLFTPNPPKFNPKFRCFFKILDFTKPKLSALFLVSSPPIAAGVLQVLKKPGYKIEVIEKNTDLIYDKSGIFDGNTVLRSIWLKFFQFLVVSNPCAYG